MAQITFYHHPDYLQNLPTWVDYRSIYEGNQQVMRDYYLASFRFETLTPEGLSALADRKARTWYTNYTARIILAWKSFFFRYDPNTVKAKTRILTESEAIDFDGNGTSFVDFIKHDILRDYLVYGWPYVLVDAPNVQAVTNSQAQSVGLRPYATSINPTEIPDWEVISSGSNRGYFSWLHYQHVQMSPRPNARAKPEMNLVRKEFAMVDGRLNVTEYKAASFDPKKYSNREPGSYQFEQVSEPVVVDRFDHIPITNLHRQSWIKDVIPEAIRYYNLRSSHENILHNSGYQKLAIVGRPIDESNRVWAENTVIQLEEGGNVIAIEPTDPTALKERLIEIKDSMFALGLNQLDRLPSDSRSVQSDQTIREKKDDVIALAKTVVSELENYTNTILADWATFKNIEFSEDDRVVFSKDFSSDDVDTLLKVFAVLKDDLEVLPKNKKSILKKLTSYYNFDTATTEENDLEVDSAQDSNLPSANNTLNSLRLGLANSA